MTGSSMTILYAQSNHLDFDHKTIYKTKFKFFATRRQRLSAQTTPKASTLRPTTIQVINLVLTSCHVYD